MPCLSPDIPKDITMENDMRYRAGKFEAMLCAVFTAMQKLDSDAQSYLRESVAVDGVFLTVLDEIDYKEGGFTKNELLNWWYAHIEKDRQRREKEKVAICQKISDLQDQLAKLNK